jgi:hypothetical protein
VLKRKDLENLRGTFSRCCEWERSKKKKGGIYCVKEG